MKAALAAIAAASVICASCAPIAKKGSERTKIERSAIRFDEAAAHAYDAHDAILRRVAEADVARYRAKLAENRITLSVAPGCAETLATNQEEMATHCLSVPAGVKAPLFMSTPTKNLKALGDALKEYADALAALAEANGPDEEAVALNRAADALAQFADSAGRMDKFPASGAERIVAASKAVRAIGRNRMEYRRDLALAKAIKKSNKAVEDAALLMGQTYDWASTSAFARGERLVVNDAQRRVNDVIRRRGSTKQEIREAEKAVEDAKRSYGNFYDAASKQRKVFEKVADAHNVLAELADHEKAHPGEDSALYAEFNEAIHELNEAAADVTGALEKKGK
ncbi:MAG: hypothetical protein ABW189_04865 [Rickettsiales bacterium]